MALALLGAGLLPAAALGGYEVSIFGAPAVFYALQPEQAHIRHASVDQWILEEDPVPRVLGSDYDVLHLIAKPVASIGNLVATKVGFADTEWWKALSALAALGESAIKHGKHYIHLDAANIYWLRGGQVFSVGAEQRPLVLRFQGLAGKPSAFFKEHQYAAYSGALRQLLDSQDARREDL
eukprot:gnl/TRDRNA2_/TRDRNA2_49018_c0_seq1.p1 gnl/TRDRNA2_/TRDRNA2_49018_c0~~gnl/TRDRNA2_/TRDRNA2_49018_c0_seq1.p1  ORF type:complete len:191 (+),score=24.95 gnl/TRDRNA2_/TRDRNA2_49018_c0_seq1:34-573(+)